MKFEAQNYKNVPENVKTILLHFVKSALKAVSFCRIHSATLQSKRF